MKSHAGLHWRLFIGALLFGAIAQATAGELTRAQFVRDVNARYFLPRMATFAKAAPNLTRTLGALCESPDRSSLDAARAAWIETMLAWESASAIGFGPLLARRAVYHIDYWPSRENLIVQALNKPPTTVRGLELVGGPAKGIPAIEWLLWTPPDKPEILADAGRCAYAKLLALDVEEESTGLDAGFAALVEGGLPDSVAADLFAGLLNLVHGEVEQIGDRKFDRPAKVDNGKTFPRLLSGQTVPAWNAQWSSLQGFLIADDGQHNDSLEQFLRAQGLAPAADKLRAAVEAVTSDLKKTQRATPTDALQIATDLRVVRMVLSDDVASALSIPIQFTVNDGD
jgi:predicted lipoprotein